MIGHMLHNRFKWWGNSPLKPRMCEGDGGLPSERAALTSASRFV
jgi:hypothetical protein